MIRLNLLNRNDPCWCGSGKKYKKCHEPMDQRIDQLRRQGVIVPERKMIKNAAQIEGIRASSLINIEVLDRVAEKICAGNALRLFADVIG